MDNSDSLKRQLEAARKTLENLEVKNAGYPALTLPAEVQVQLDEQRARVMQLEAELAKTASAPEESDADSFPFTNRQEEIKLILDVYAPAYYLLDAPTGYGKTNLLHEIEGRFQQQGWSCVYVAVDEHHDLNTVIDHLAAKLGIKLTKPDSMPPGLQLAGALKNQLERNPKQGLALLIDLEKKPSLVLVQQLFSLLIPLLEVCLRQLEFFEKHHNRFRVIMAGRYLAMRPAVRKVSLPLEVLRLSPFQYDVVRKAARDYLPTYNENSVSLIAAHTFFITGGHPGCVAQVLKEYRSRGMTPDVFINFFSQHIWEDIVRPIVNELRAGLAENTKELYKVIGRLSVFRYVDYEILRQMMGEWKDLDIDSEYDLADELTSTYLLDWKGRVLRDDLARRLLAMALFREQPEEFAAFCRHAQALCAEHIRQSGVQKPEIWMLEYLHQALQQNAALLLQAKSAERRQLRQKFILQDVPAALQILLQERVVPARSYQAEHKALLQTLEEDWELRFTVNYYLRSDQYDQTPYADLLATIDNWFAKANEGAKHG